MTSSKIYGLVGFPVSHSLSPLMHNAAFVHLKIDAEYRLFPLKENELVNFFKDLKQNNISGFNVTVPYKEKVIPFLDEITPLAKGIGAANTVEIINGKLKGHNTDAQGLLMHLKNLSLELRGKKVAILGAGGAAKAVFYIIAAENPQSIALYDVDLNKASNMVAEFKKEHQSAPVKVAISIEDLDISNSDLLINATPIGMEESDPVLVDEKFLHKNLFVYDLIYNPKETKLLKLAKSKGAKISNGLGMLLYQGMLAFEIWTGKEAPKKIMQEALAKAAERVII